MMIMRLFLLRMFVWRSLLRLPENHAAFSSLTDKGLHSAYLSIQERYPIKSHKLQRGLQRYTYHLPGWHCGPAVMLAWHGHVQMIWNYE